MNSSAGVPVLRSGGTRAFTSKVHPTCLVCVFSKCLSLLPRPHQITQEDAAAGAWHVAGEPIGAPE